MMFKGLPNLAASMVGAMIFTASGCGAAPSTSLPSPIERTLPSGRVIKVVTVARFARNQGEPYLWFEYISEYRHVSQLRAEVEDVWSALRPSAERAGIKVVNITSWQVDYPKLIRGTPTRFTQRLDGTWKM